MRLDYLLVWFKSTPFFVVFEFWLIEVCLLGVCRYVQMKITKQQFFLCEEIEQVL